MSKKSSSITSFLFSPPALSWSMVLFGIIMGYIMGSCISARWIYPAIVDIHEDAMDTVMDRQKEANTDLALKQAEANKELIDATRSMSSRTPSSMPTARPF